MGAKEGKKRNCGGEKEIFEYGRASGWQVAAYPKADQSAINRTTPFFPTA
jgi:hypothetical protein